MKRIILLLLICPLFLNGQDVLYKNSVWFSPYGSDYANLDISMKSLADHELLTQFTYIDINFVNSRLTTYLDKQLWYGLDGENAGWVQDGEDWYIVEPYKRKVGNDSNRKIQVKYKVLETLEGYNLVQSVEIKGYVDDIVDLFLGYWDTLLNFDVITGPEIAVRYTLQDKIILAADIIKQEATIYIVSTTYNSYDEFREYINEKETLN